MIRLGAFVSHPIQYQAPLFRYLTDHPQIDLTVYFGSKRGYEQYDDEDFGEQINWDVPLVDGYQYRFLDNVLPVDGNSIFRFNPEIHGILSRGDHNAFWVHGLGAIANWFAIGIALTYDVPIIYRAETTPFEDPSAYRRFREWTNGVLFNRVDAFAYIGRRNRRYYRSHGVPDHRLFHAPYTVPNGFFREAREKLPDSNELRRAEGLPTDRPIVAFVGKLIDRKQPDMLLEAFSKATEPAAATLLFVGDGNRREALKSKALRLGRSEDVVFAGFVNQRSLPRFYEMADVFVLPSREENWGLVVNEAMNFELPIVVSDAVGCAPDLVDDDNGMIFSSDDSGALESALVELCEDERLRRRLGERSADRISEWGIPETAEGIVRAAEFVTN